MIACGRPNCTDRLIVPTSRVTRVTRSPVDAPSTRPSGRRRTVATMYSTGRRQQVLAEDRRDPLCQEGQQGLRADHTDDDHGEPVEAVGDFGSAGPYLVHQVAEQDRHDERRARREAR